MSKNKLLVLLAVFSMTMGSVFAQPAPAQTPANPGPAATADANTPMTEHIWVHVDGQKVVRTGAAMVDVTVPNKGKIEVKHAMGVEVHLLTSKVMNEKGVEQKLSAKDIKSGSKLTVDQMNNFMTTSFMGKKGYKWHVVLVAKKDGQEAEKLEFTFVNA